MITKTMYYLMIKQKKHQIAFEILKAMEHTSTKKKFVKDEIKKIQKYINRGT